MTQTKRPATEVEYSSTNLTKFVFPSPQKSFTASVKLLGKAIRMIREKQRELYGTSGSMWLERYFFEIITTNKPIEELDQYIKKGF